MKKRNRKRIVTVSFFTALIFGLIYYYRSQYLQKAPSPKAESVTRTHTSPVFNICICSGDDYRPHGNVYNRNIRTNIMFLKTHKCASSTIQNILMRFGLRHSLNFVLPKKNNYIGYFANFSETLLAPTTRTRDGKYNILTHHTRYSTHLRKTAMYADAAIVTILREPSRLFESLFHYYKLHNVYGVTFRDFLNSLPYNGTMNDYSDVFSFYQKKSRRPSKFGHNQMCRDLGLPESWFRNKSAIEDFIAKIDKEFDYVMIAEHVEVSLVLLANLMKWPLSYVSFLPINSRPHAGKCVISRADTRKLVRLNYADVLLYRYFLNKFKNSVLQYGVDLMVKNVRKLKQLNRELRQKCVFNENHKGYARTIGYEVKNTSDCECVYSAKPELRFTAELKNMQTKRLGTISKS